MIAVTGYSQGAQIADTVIRNIGSGKGPITADKLAAGALFSSPNRPQGASTFPRRLVRAEFTDTAQGRCHLCLVGSDGDHPRPLLTAAA